MALPPWLNISPADYLRAVEAGTQAGLSIRQANQRAWEASQRLALESEAQQQRYAALAEESAQRMIAQEGLDRYRQGELANRQSELGIQQQGLGLRGEGLAIQRERAKDIFSLGQEREKDRQSQRDFMNEFRQSQAKATQEAKDRSLDLRERALKVPELSDAYKQLDEARRDMAKLYQTPVPKSKAKEHQSAMDDATMRMRDARVTIGRLDPNRPSVPPPDVVNYAPKETQAAPPPVASPAQPKKRVKVKGPKGQTGTIEEGDTLLPGWTKSE